LKEYKTFEINTFWSLCTKHKFQALVTCCFLATFNVYYEILWSLQLLHKMYDVNMSDITTETWITFTQQSFPGLVVIRYKQLINVKQK